MANFVKIPYLNPYRFYEAVAGVPVYNLLADFEYQIDYCKKIEFTDYCTIQIWAICDIGNITINLVNSSLTVIKTFNVGQKISPYVTPFTIGEVNEVLSGVAEGVYYLHINVNDGANNIDYYSEPLYIKQTHPNTMKIIYYNDENNFDVIFDSTYSDSIQFHFRVEGGFLQSGKKFATKSKTYENELVDRTLLNSTPYEVEQFILGNSIGVPTWIAEKYNRIISCTNVYYNGIQYCMSDGARLEPIRPDLLYPFAVWTIDLEKSINKFSDETGIASNTVIGYNDNAIGFDTNVLGYQSIN